MASSVSGDPSPGVPDQRARARPPAAGRPGRGVRQGPQEVHQKRGGVHEKARGEETGGLKSFFLPSSLEEAANITRRHPHHLYILLRNKWTFVSFLAASFVL